MGLKMKKLGFGVRKFQNLNMQDGFSKIDSKLDDSPAQIWVKFLGFDEIFFEAARDGASRQKAPPWEGPRSWRRQPPERVPTARWHQSLAMWASATRNVGPVG